MLVYWRWFLFILIGACYFLIPNARVDFTRFNCNDSECYLALANGLAKGLGYTRSMVKGDYVAHTTWPPGVPVLMIPAIALSGERLNWFAVKSVTIVFGLIGIVVAWHLGKRLSGRDSAGDLAACFVGLNPYYWDFSHQAMAEGPLIVWILVSALLVDVVWAKRRPTVPQALLVGAFCGLGMMFKGHAIGLILAPAAYLVGNRASLGTRFERLHIFTFFAIAFTLPFLCWSARNTTVSALGFDGINQVRMIRAKDPCDVNSPLLTTRELLRVIRKNALINGLYRLPAQTLPFLWHERAWNYPGSGYLYLPLTLVMLVLSAPWNTR